MVIPEHAAVQLGRVGFFKSLPEDRLIEAEHTLYNAIIHGHGLYWLTQSVQASILGALLTYASALLAGCRLEELGYLTSFVAHECRGRAEWADVLRTFLLEVDSWVLARYGGRFAPITAAEKSERPPVRADGSP